MKSERLNRFLELSRLLTGFSRIDLEATGLVTTYSDVLERNVEETLLADLLALAGKIASQPKTLAQMEEDTRVQIIANTKYGALAKNILKMWYLGSWNGTSFPRKLIKKVCYGPQSVRIHKRQNSRAMAPGLCLRRRTRRPPPRERNRTVKRRCASRKSLNKPPRPRFLTASPYRARASRRVHPALLYPREGAAVMAANTAARRKEFELGKNTTRLHRFFEEIDTMASLRMRLQIAVELEASTLPPYLCALRIQQRSSDRAGQCGIAVSLVFRCIQAA